MIPCTETPNPWYKPVIPSFFAILAMQSPRPENCRSEGPKTKKKKGWEMKFGKWITDLEIMKRAKLRRCR